jgi:Fe-S-cluster containining protein
MTCQGCGACCVGLRVEVRPSIDDVPEDLICVDEEGDTPILVMQQRDDGSCVALVGGECSIYDRRPQVCRDFEPGGAHCLVMLRRKEPAT